MESQSPAVQDGYTERTGAGRGGKIYRPSFTHLVIVDAEI